LFNEMHIGDRGKDPQTTSACGSGSRLSIARAAVSRSADKDEVAGTVGALEAMDLSNGLLAIG